MTSDGKKPDDTTLAVHPSRRKSKGGRPSLIDQKTMEDVFTALRAGNYTETAAAYAGICRATYDQWLRRGRRELRRLKKSPRAKMKASEIIYVAFYKGCRKALADAEARDVSLIARAATGGARIVEVKEVMQGTQIVSRITTTKELQGEWTAAAWRLERRYPKRWGRRLAIRKDETPGEETPEVFAEKVRAAFSSMTKLIGGSDEDDPPEDAEVVSPNDPQVPPSETEE